MQELNITNKQKFLDDSYPFVEVPKLTDMKRCIHCDKVFIVGDYKVYKDNEGDEFICCPNAPDCDGTVTDWFKVD